MKLHTVNGSPNCRKVEAVIKHLKLDVELVYYDVFAGDLQHADFGKLNPNHMVPTLEDGDFLLNESNAINQYLADQVPGNTLLPNDARTRADITRWQCWELAHYNRALGYIAYETMLKPMLMKAEPDQQVVTWNVEKLKRFAGILNDHLEGRTFMVGESPTLADFSIGSLEIFEKSIPFDWSPYPNVSAYYERFRSCSVWASTAPASPEEMGRKPKAIV